MGVGTVGNGTDSHAPAAPSPLRIAVLSPIAWRTPPRHYGPWELFASTLAEGLVALGHEVSLFATADSLTTAHLRSTVATGWSEDDDIDPKVAECIHIADVFEHADEFDIIHNGFDFLPLTYSGLVDTPVVTTIHGFSSEKIVRVYERYDATTTYVAISDSDRHARLHYAATIHHGIDVDAFACSRSPGDHLLFFGRIHPDKGTAEAIQVAHRAGRPLVIAGIVQDEQYFTDGIVAHIDGESVRFLGPVDSANRAQVLGSAHALLPLIDFDEPFGYSVVEAMACGTPVRAGLRRTGVDLCASGRFGRSRRRVRTSRALIGGTRRAPVRSGSTRLRRCVVRRGAGDVFFGLASLDHRGEDLSVNAGDAGRGALSARSRTG